MAKPTAGNTYKPPQALHGAVRGYCQIARQMADAHGGLGTYILAGNYYSSWHSVMNTGIPCFGSFWKATSRFTSEEYGKNRLPKVEYFIYAVPLRKQSKAFKEAEKHYVDFLINGSFFSHLYINKDVNYHINVAGVQNTKQHSNVHLVAAIFDRMRIERPSYIPTWHHMVKNGLTGNEALFFQSVLQYNLKLRAFVVNHGPTFGGHQVFSNGETRVDALQNYLRNKIVWLPDKSLLRDNSFYNSFSWIWSEGGRDTKAGSINLSGFTMTAEVKALTHPKKISLGKAVWGNIGEKTVDVIKPKDINQFFDLFLKYHGVER